MLTKTSGHDNGIQQHHAEGPKQSNTRYNEVFDIK